MARRNLQIGVIGLGKFGFAFGKSLVDIGKEVVGLDSDPENVRRAQEVFTQVYQADAMDKRVLDQLGFRDFTHVVVSVGSSIEASAMISLYLKEIGAAEVWVKAVSSDHENLLRKIGVDQVIFPERFAATQLAHRMAYPGLIEYLPFDPDVALQEIRVDNWEGRNLRDLNLTNLYQVQVIAMRKLGMDSFSFIPRADEPLQKGDVMIVIGRREQLGKLKS